MLSLFSIVDESAEGPWRVLSSRRAADHAADPLAQGGAVSQADGELRQGGPGVPLGRATCPTLPV